MVFPNGSGLFQQDEAPCHTTHILKEWSVEHDEEFAVLPWPLSFPDLSSIKLRLDVLEQEVRSTVAPPRN